MKKNLRKMCIMLALILLFTSVSISAYAGSENEPNNIQIVNEVGSFEVCVFEEVNKLTSNSTSNSIFSRNNVLEVRLVDNFEKSELVYEVTVPYKGYLDYSYDFEGNKIDTAIIVYNGEGKPIGGIYTDDVSENELRIDNNMIIRSIGSTPNETVKLRAVSLTFDDFYFSKSGWITRAGEPFPLSLSLYPKRTGPWEQYPGEGWAVVLDEYENDSKWENESGLYNQWYCHYLTVKFAKASWNLEPKRPYANLSSTIGQGCNPE